MIGKLNKMALLAMLTFSSVIMATDKTELPSEVTLFKNVNVWDGTSEQLKKDLDVLVVHNKIKKIAKEIPTSGTYELDVESGGVKQVDFPAEGLDAYTFKTVDKAGESKKVQVKVNIIDGGGRTLMPGLINSHVHLTHTLVEGGVPGWNALTWEDIGAIATASAKEYLMMGFTTVRDMGGMADGFKRAIDKGLIEGPRIYNAGGYIAQTSGHGDLRMRGQPNAQTTGIQYSNLERLGIIRIADGVPNMLTAVRENFANGAAYIKIHAGGGVSSEKDPLHTLQYTPEELEAANKAVRAWDTYWTVHAYTSETVNQALDAGALCIDHAQMIDEKTIKRISKEGIFLTSNLAGMSRDQLKHPLYGNPKNPQYIKITQFMDGSKNFAKWIKEYNVKWSFGDDLVLSTQTYFRKHVDFEKWYAGKLFGNHFALKGMTSTPGQLARLTGKNNPYPGKLGVIEEGAYADILIVDGNPLKDLAAIGADKAWFEAKPRSQDMPAIRVIMKDGKIYKNTL
jgi:imidazolonepropionase-like amidohydrolase